MARVSSVSTLYKKDVETRQYAMDFSNLLATAETIEASSPAPVATQERVGGGVTTDLSIGVPAISGQNVTVTIAGGIDGRKYRVNILITTSAGQILEGDGILSVRD